MTRLARTAGCATATVALSLGAITSVAAAGDAATPAAHPRRIVITLVNARRIEHGLRPLRLRLPVRIAAQKHSWDQARMHDMTHTGSDGSDCGDRLLREGYRWSAWGENVAAGYPTARSVVRAWMHSAGHRANILSVTFRHIGVGRARADNGTIYWTLDLARRA